MGARGHQVDHALADPVDVEESRAVETERETGAGEGLVHGVEVRGPERYAVHGVGPDDAGDEAEVVRASRPHAAAATGSWGGITAVPINRSGSALLQSAIQSFHTWCDATASSTSSKPPSD